MEDSTRLGEAHVTVRKRRKSHLRKFRIAYWFPGSGVHSSTQQVPTHSNHQPLLLGRIPRNDLNHFLTTISCSLTISPPRIICLLNINHLLKPSSRINNHHPMLFPTAAISPLRARASNAACNASFNMSLVSESTWM